MFKKKGNERGGIIHKILAMCVKIKVKNTKRERFKDKPTAAKKEDG